MTIAEKTFLQLLNRFKVEERDAEITEIVLCIPKDDLAELGAHVLKTSIGFLAIVTSKSTENSTTATAAETVSDNSVM